jgi:hypothetical protein
VANPRTTFKNQGSRPNAYTHIQVLLRSDNRKKTSDLKLATTTLHTCHDNVIDIHAATYDPIDHALTAGGLLYETVLAGATEEVEEVHLVASLLVLDEAALRTVARISGQQTQYTAHSGPTGYAATTQNRRDNRPVLLYVFKSCRNTQ